MKKNILIVYKSKETYNVLNKILSKLNYKILKASVDNQAIRMIDKHEIDLLISDLELSGFDSLVLLKRIQDKSPDVPILLISSEERKYKHEIIKEFGITEIINFPIEHDTLKLIVSRYL